MIKLILGLLFILLGVFLGLYLGFWICFIGGIIQTIEALKTNPIESLNVALGISKILISGFIGWLSFIFCTIIGSTIIEK